MKIDKKFAGALLIGFIIGAILSGLVFCKLGYDAGYFKGHFDTIIKADSRCLDDLDEQYDACQIQIDESYKDGFFYGLEVMEIVAPEEVDRLSDIITLDSNFIARRANKW